MLDQQQPPLFRLPLELREAIYGYYAQDDKDLTHDDKGLIYDHSKLRYTDQTRHKERSGLICSCKAAAELHATMILVNTITFVSVRSDDKAGRFERLLQASRRMKIHMLHYVAGCVTPVIVDQVAQQFSGIARCYRSAFDTIKDGTTLYGEYGLLNSTKDCRWRWQTSAAFYDAIRYTPELASSHPKF
jgi:hypothetical protein